MGSRLDEDPSKKSLKNESSESGPSSLEVYHHFFRKALSPFCICNAEGRFCEINESWEKVLGYTCHELIGKPVIDFLHPEDRTKALQHIEFLRKTNKPVYCENRVAHRDGSYRWFRWSAHFHEASREIFITATDVTEEKETLLKLQETKAQLRETLASEVKARSEAQRQGDMLKEVFEQTPCLASMTEGPLHIFRYANESYMQLMGERAILGKTVREVVPDLDPEVFEILDEVYRTGEKFVAKDRGITADWLADGHISERFFTFVYAPILNDEGRSTGIWCMAFDITELKRLENFVQIAERVTAIGRMAAGVAHEINNPLAYILGSLSLLQKKLEKLDSENLEASKSDLQNLARKSETGVLRIRDIVRSLNRLSEDGKSEGLEVVLVEDVITTALEYAKNQTLHKALVFTEVEKGLMIRVNKGSFIQVLLNLIINAAQSMKAGAIEKNEIRIRAYSGPPGSVTLMVSDTGQGIPRENLDRIFDPFFTSKAAGEGSGLGLSISHGIIKSLGGEISVESEVEKGTTFTIIVPAVLNPL